MSGIVLTATQTRMQILNPTPSAVYNGMIQGGYRIATGEGILSLWRGMSSVVVGAGLYIWVVIRGDNR
jgi:solute carrier family 25 iron transporter 28/37